jgi:UDP-N-acetylmuramoylalanine--D-glutamate ligase
MLQREGGTVHIGGNIGTPLLCKADSMNPDDIAVLELSSFQLITMKKSPDIAVVTNLAPNHLDIHANMDEYVEAKRNIFMHQKCIDRVVLNFDNEYTRRFAEYAPGEVVFFSSREEVENGVYLAGGTIYDTKCGRREAIVQAGDIWLPGAHNIENFMAAFASVRGIVSYGVMRETAAMFRGVKHRIEFVRELRGVRYFNDSIASSPTRAIAGLRAFDQKVILIAGGKGKGIAFDDLGDEIVARVKTLVLTGMTAEQIRDCVVNATEYTGFPEILLREDFTDAILVAAESAREGDIVLLSPACTSFDRFRNFEERGNMFKDIVKRLE